MTSLAAGKPAPLGASYDGGVNFALFSAHAERVELCVFDEQGNEQRFDLPARSGDIWHGWLALPGRACATAIGCMVPGTRGTALTRPSCCSIPARTGSRAICLTTNACTAECGSRIIATAPR
jgi:glycogen operon protein